MRQSKVYLSQQHGEILRLKTYWEDAMQNAQI